MEKSQNPQNNIPYNLRGKKVVLINHSDTLGGAAIVTFRLMQVLRQEGIEARMVVYTKTSSEENVSSISTRFIRAMAFCMERSKLIMANGFNYDDLFKISSGDFALNVHHHPWVKEADIVCLNWFNQGLLSVNGIRKLHEMGKKIVWTMHDMWAMTGICHHSYECNYFIDDCGNCQFLYGGGNPNDLSHKIWEKKKKLYSEVPITFVAVSNWLERRARESSLLRNCAVTTINNPFPIDLFYTSPRKVLYSLDTPTKPNLILMGAARLDDPIKGLDYAIEAMNNIFDNHPEIANETAIYLFGSMRNPERLDELRMSHRWLGRINDFKILRYLYSSAKVVLSTSLYETLGGTLVEGQAGGALPVTFGGDGRDDVVEHLKNGYIARHGDALDIAQGVIWAIKSNIDRDYLHESVRERFSAPIIAQKYIKLFSDIIG